MPVLSGVLFLKIVGILLLLVVIHMAVALSTAILHGLLFPNEEYDANYFVVRVTLVAIGGIAVVLSARIIFLLGGGSR